MIYSKAVIQVETLLLHCHRYVIEVLSAYVEIAWHSVQLEEAFKAAALLLGELCLCSRSQVLPGNIFLDPRLNTQIIATLV